MYNTYSNKVFPTTIGTFKAFNQDGQSEIYSNEHAANIFARTGGPLIEYKGFHISANCRIFKNGVQVFTAPWQHPDDIQGCKDIIDKSTSEKAVKLKQLSFDTMTAYERWQLEKYGSIIPDMGVTPDGELEESGFEELNRLAEFINANQ